MKKAFVNLFKKRNRVKKIIKKPHKDGKCTGSLDPMLKNQNHSEEDMRMERRKEGGWKGVKKERERLYILINPLTPALEVTYILTPGVLLQRTSTPMRKNKTWWLTPATQHLGCRRKA